MKNKKFIYSLCIICLLLTGCNKQNKQEKNYFSQWKQDGVINELIKYVEDVTNEKSSNYIPKEDRIAVFDLDGTLLCEQAPIYCEWMMFAQRVLDDPTFSATQEMKDIAAQILNA